MVDRLWDLQAVNSLVSMYGKLAPFYGLRCSQDLRMLIASLFLVRRKDHVASKDVVLNSREQIYGTRTHVHRQPMNNVDLVSRRALSRRTPCGPANLTTSDQELFREHSPSFTQLPDPHKVLWSRHLVITGIRSKPNDLVQSFCSDFRSALD